MMNVLVFFFVNERWCLRVEVVPDVRAVVGFDVVPVGRADPMVDDFVTVLVVVLVFFVTVDVAPASKMSK